MCYILSCVTLLSVLGEEYVEDIKSDVGKVIGFKCVLCDCRFNDVVAKTAHIKGRRHRLTYKVSSLFFILLFTFSSNAHIFLL